MPSALGLGLGLAPEAQGQLGDLSSSGVGGGTQRCLIGPLGIEHARNKLETADELARVSPATKEPQFLKAGDGSGKTLLQKPAVVGSWWEPP